MKSKIVCSILLFIFFFSFSHTCSQYQHSGKLSLNKFSLTDANIIQLKEKSSFLAGTLSFIVPGLALGQIYNNVPSKIFRHLSISIGSFTLLLIAGEFGWYRMDIACGASNHDTWIPYTIAFIYLGNWVWSIFDAAITANEINKKAQYKKSRSNILNKIRFGLTLDKNINPKLKISFAL